MKNVAMIMITLLSLSFVGCTASQHRAAVQDDSADRVTVGIVQKEIRVGMSGAEVVQTLGSPNIVSTDEKRREVWVYDKIAIETAYSTSRVGTLILGIGISITGGGGTFSANSGAASKSQRTLTIIIKFDEEGLVRDFAYHASRF